MLWIILPYLLAMVVTLGLVAAATAVLIHYGRLSGQLPDACRLPGLKAAVTAAEKDLSLLNQKVADARVVVAERNKAETWLAAHGPAYEDARRKLPVLAAQLAEVRKDHEGLMQERMELQTEITESKHQREWLRQEDRRISDRLEHETTELERARAAVEAFQSREAGLQALLEELETRRQSREQQLRDVQAELPGAIKQLEDTHERIKVARMEGQTLEVQASGLRAQVQQLSDRVSQDGQAAQRMEQRLKELSEKEASLTAHVHRLEAKKADQQHLVEETAEQLKQVKTELEAATKELLQTTTEHERRKAEIEQFKIEHNNVIRLLQAAEKRWTQLAPASGGAEEQRLAELWSPVLKADTFAAGEHVGDEAASLAATERYLEGLGLRFPKRVLRAFHTSLKVSDISPLTVLAGISGTGKSELPRRYAEGMGLHFLNIPVQPRWDSPQDMFGFYNYMENRYRATELARALVQMDPYHAEPQRSWNYPPDWAQHSRCNHMLLVLLDEMNLARVEYYFSEFLSRLETRRGINCDNAAARRKAEVLLEVGLRNMAKGNGSVAKHQPTMPLFIANNVLFVGTMNEDETTQTLSDKVVDRANVMRFGKPARLVQATRTAQSVTPVGRALPYATWRSWLHSDADLSHEVDEQLNNWIEQLNGAMQAIRRPFAHRTSRAIRSYVANYPDPAAYRDAMADQIELKILPKFRGLDPQENSTRQAMQRIRYILSELRDDRLLAAIDECLQQGEHQFVWQGLDRSAQ